MKNLTLALCIPALSMLGLTSASAQDASKSDPTRYDTMMEKRADLRMKYAQAQRKASAAKTAAQQNTGDTSTLRKHQTRIDHSYMVDYMARSAKRADLRARATQIGTEKAYQEWLLREHGH